MDLKGMLDVLLANVVEELKADGTGENLCAASLFPGDTFSMDYGGCGGLVMVRLSTAHPSASFPNADVGVDNCAYTLAYPVEVGVFRPAPMIRTRAGKAMPPGDKENTESTHLMIDDMHAMHRAIRRLREDADLLTIGSYTPQGPLGDLVGGSWSLTVGEDL
jgi:hypothetical protein